MKFSERLIAARRHANLSQQELALRLNCTQGLISKMERGDQDETALIVKIAKICGVSAYWLDGGVGEMIDQPYELNNQMRHVLKAMQKGSAYENEMFVKIADTIFESTQTADTSTKE